MNIVANTEPRIQDVKVTSDTITDEMSNEYIKRAGV